MFNRGIENLKMLLWWMLTQSSTPFLDRDLMYCNSALHRACTLACDAPFAYDTEPKVARQQEVDKNQQHILLIAALAGVHPC